MTRVKSILQRGIEAQVQSLVEFGYPTVTAEEVAAAHRKWLAKEPATEIVAMFCEQAFDEHPSIFGRQA